MKKFEFKKKKFSYILIFLILVVYIRIFFVFFIQEKKEDRVVFSKKIDELKITEKITGLNFIRVNKGIFFMGSPEDETGRKSDESPLSKIKIDEFMISENEVRVKDFSIFVSETNYLTSAEKEGYSYVYSGLTGNWEKKKGISWKNPGFEQTDNHPVVHVSFFDAREFADWLDRKNKKYKIRLVKENEWEFAAKKGMLKKQTNICNIANCADESARQRFSGWKISSCNDGHIFTSPVKSFLPDGLGLYDMIGNVWEWCDSEYKPYITPKNSTIYGKNKNVVIKGGSFYSKPEFLRASAREHLSSGTKRAYDIGFRLALTPK
ncbi:MAG: SUMF1/EgtB/PvdO family nonheme iron enzyme [Desulforegulaceae bacterium]|nr:SUMF1/EgtB/PvdO family nonheme iron enzyme [Desulforegulaceae bacterium]